MKLLLHRIKLVQSQKHIQVMQPLQNMQLGTEKKNKLEGAEFVVIQKAIKDKAKKEYAVIGNAWMDYQVSEIEETETGNSSRRISVRLLHYI